jgi:hypothetical protein
MRKPVGDPMKVLAVALPFVTVQLCAAEQTRGCLDTRQIKFQQVDVSYVRSLIPTYGKRSKKLSDAEKRAQEAKVREVYKGGSWQTVLEPRHE